MLKTLKDLMAIFTSHLNVYDKRLHRCQRILDVSDFLESASLNGSVVILRTVPQCS